MQTVRGRFNGETIELLDDVPAAEGAYVLVTFLEGSLETAAARVDRRAVSVATYTFDAYAEPLRRRLAVQPVAPDAPRPYTVGEVMTHKVITVPAAATVAEATHLMKLHGITSIMVEPGESGEWGIMTMRDVLKKIVTADRNPEDVAVEELTTRPLIYVTPDMSLRECSKLMIDGNIRRAAVREHGKLIGVISDTDIFQLVEERGWGPEPHVEKDYTS